MRGHSPRRPASNALKDALCPAMTADGSRTGGPTSAPDHEKVAQQRRGLGLPDAATDFRPVQAGGGREITHAVLDRAALWIGGAPIDPADAGEPDRPPAQRPGL